MRIALIDPLGMNKGLNVGLGILAGCLQKTGHLVQVVDLNNAPGNSTRRLEAVSGHDIIGVSLKSSTLDSSRRIARRIGRRDLICGGPHVTLDGINLLKENPEFEFGFAGEAEESLIEFVEAKQKKSPPENIEGIITRNCGSREADAASFCRKPNQNLDSLSFPAFDLFDSLGTRMWEYPLITSRGCPYSCIYCCVGKLSGKQMRFRSIGSVIEEIEQARTKYNPESFSVLDDNFTFDLGRAKRFCRGLIDNRLGLVWSCPNGIRADRIDDELVSLMKDSGCYKVSVGIESFDDEVFFSIKKGEEKKDILDAIQLLKKHSIEVNGFFLVGLPGDNLEKTRKSLAEIQRIGLDTAQWNMLVPYPGTQAWDWVRKKRRILADWRNGYHYGANLRPTFDSPHFSEKEMILAYKLTNIKCRNYSAFFDRRFSLLRNSAYLLWLILRYDGRRVFSHLSYLFSNIPRLVRLVG
jgi:anaerobic magnesium-protoporphyrin IX monomethyl ester cyclase